MTRIGLAVPTAAPDAEPTTAVEFGKRAEAAGAESGWGMDPPPLSTQRAHTRPSGAPPPPSPRGRPALPHRAEPALRRIARLGDGFIGSSSGGPRAFKENWAKIQDMAHAAGRDPSELTPAALIYSCVDDDRSVAEQKAIAYRQHYYGGRRPID